MLAILIGVVMAMLWTGHASPSGRWLRRALVEQPAAWLSRVKISHLAVILLSLVAVAGAFCLFDGEGVRVIGASAAEAAAWFIACDVGSYIEAYAVLLALGATRQGRIVLDTVRRRVVRAAKVAVRAHARQAGSPARRDRSPSDLDPDPEGWSALAA